ncbi:MAG: hypothetical protein AB7O26_04465 [Planctomycetaceae bacterium]
MSVDISMYAERRRNGFWQLFSPTEVRHDNCEVLRNLSSIYEGDHKEENYPLARVLVDAGSQQTDGENSQIFPRG